MPHNALPVAHLRGLLGASSTAALALAPAVALGAPFSSENPAPAGLFGLIARMGPSDWAGIALGTAIVFGILGRKLLKDIRGWMA